MKKNNKKIIILTIIIIIVFAILTIVIGTISKNKKEVTKLEKQKNEDYSIKIANKQGENEKVKIEIDNIAYADRYLIIDYTVKAKNSEEPFFIENYSRKNEFGFYLDRTIKIDGKSIELKDDYSDQISYKISDNEVKVYDIIEIEDLPEKFDLEVKFFENDFTVIPDENDDEDDDEEIYEELEDDIEDLSENDENEDDNDSEEGESLLTDEEYEEIKDEYTEDWEDEEVEETEDEEIIEEVEGYYDGTEQTEENDEDETEIEVTNEEIGEITTKATKEELTKDVSIINYDEKYEENNILIENQKILKTPFKTFIIAETTITEIEYENIQSDLLGDPFLYKIDIEDKDGNTINVKQQQQIKIMDEEETELDDLEISEDNIPNNLIAEIKTIIILGDDTKEEVKLQPYYYSYDFPNDDDIKIAMQNKEWLKIEDDEYIENNSYNGEITITKIEEKNNQILFYYTKKGFTPDVESVVLLRNSTKEFNVFYPDIVKLKDINSEENIVGYNIENNTSYSYTDDFEDDNLGEIEDLEFTVLEGLEIQKIGEGFIIDI